MSTKLEKDEEIATGEVERVDPASEEVADLLFEYGIGCMDWLDIANTATVCRGWRHAVHGPAATHAHFGEAFKAHHGEKSVNKLYAWRGKREDKAVEQCLLLLLEGQMLLRELAEYKKSPAPKLYADIRHQIAKFPVGDSEEQDLLATIQQLRKELLQGFKRNSKLEQDQKDIEHKAHLLIMHRTSIIELDRKKRAKKKKAGDDSDKPTFYSDSKKMARYSELYYLLRTEPKYFAKLAYLIPPVKKEKQQFAETVILTMYANAFSPLEEFLLIELLQKAVENEIKNATKIEEFTETDSVVPMMIMSYNKRKQGRQYIKSIFAKPLNDLIESNERFGADPNGTLPDTGLLTKWCDKFFPLIVDSIDSLPYGLRYICKNIHDLSREKFKKAKEIDYWRAVGYFIYYRFIGLAIITPDEFGLCDKDQISGSEIALSLISISKILKAVFSDLQPIRDGGPFGVMNDWIENKLGQVIEYFKKVIDVAPPEDFLHVNKYAQLSKIEKDSLVITLREIVSIHTLAADNKEELAPDDKDPLRIILNDLGDVPKCPPDDETEIQLELSNRFPPQLSKLDRKKNLKTETIDDAIKIMQKIPGFSGDTFLEIFVRMKLHCQKAGEAELAKEVNNVIANLQNLAKHGLVKPDNGFNSFLKDIQAEVQARGRRKQEHMKEIERLQRAIKELDEQKEHMDQRIAALNTYLDSVRKKAAESFTPQTRKFKYKDLEKAKVISDSEIPPSQQNKVKFVFEQKTMDEFHITGKINGLPVFTREFVLQLEQLLAAKENGEVVFDTEKGLELYVASTIMFLNNHFFSHKK